MQKLLKKNQWPLCEITMTAGILYAYPGNWKDFKALFAAQYSGIQVGMLSVAPHFHFVQTNYAPKFLYKFPASFQNFRVTMDPVYLRAASLLTL